MTFSVAAKLCLVALFCKLGFYKDAEEQLQGWSNQPELARCSER